MTSTLEGRNHWKKSSSCWLSLTSLLKNKEVLKLIIFYWSKLVGYNEVTYFETNPYFSVKIRNLF